jgi:NAD-dependent deacetylase
MSDLERVRRWIARAGTVSVLSGAGISAESGIPTFRGEGGLWKGQRPEELATPQAFAGDPERVWEFYQWRRRKVAGCRPNPGHFALARLEAACSDFRLMTQNVDGFHQAAGSVNVVEVHGSLWTLRCTGCGAESENRELDLPPVPACADCDAPLRPGVVWFGEALRSSSLVAMERAAAEADLLLVVGTSAVVYPAAGMVAVARDAGARVVEVNLGETAATPVCDAALHGRSGDLLPLLIREP